MNQFEGIFTETENTEMDIEKDISKEIFSSAAMSSQDWQAAQEPDRNINPAGIKQCQATIGPSAKLHGDSLTG